MRVPLPPLVGSFLDSRTLPVILSCLDNPNKSPFKNKCLPQVASIKGEHRFCVQQQESYPSSLWNCYNFNSEKFWEHSMRWWKIYIPSIKNADNEEQPVSEAATVWDANFAQTQTWKDVRIQSHGHHICKDFENGDYLKKVRPSKTISCDSMWATESSCTWSQRLSKPWLRQWIPFVAPIVSSRLPSTWIEGFLI